MPRHSLRIKEKQTALDNSRGPDATVYEDSLKDEERSRKRVRNRSRSAGTKTTSNDLSVESDTKKKKQQRIPEHFRKVRGKLGMLARLAKDVPLDVMFEVGIADIGLIAFSVIFYYLGPGDLLRLARTSNDLRGILMSKSSGIIWRAARGNVEDLPPLPLDLNEPQFPNIDNKEFQSTLPSAFQGHEILPQELIPGSSKRQNLRKVVNYKITARLVAEFEALQTPEDRTAWIARKTQERQSTSFEWHQSRLRKRADELDDIRKERRQAILDRLEEIGWRKEAEKILDRGDPWHDEFSTHKFVKQSKKLTQYGWNCIRTELVELFAILALRKEYNDIRSASDLREPFPAVGDILTYKVFEDLVWDTPQEIILTCTFFRKKLLEHLPGILDKWRPAKVQELVRIMQKSIPTATAADLHLATSVFQCTECPSHYRMHYPQMFYHPCFSQNPPANSLSAERMKIYLYNTGPWTSRHIVLSESGSQIAKTILESCSLDPTTATVKDLQSVNPLIECTSCYINSDENSYEAGRAFMRWPSALVHSSDHILAINSFGEETEQIIALRTRTQALVTHE
ncbi:hypothetical protein BT96DRAFT_983257 [Gymnopus androsaceus JB14]|uniref:F-box domain-containing protein n=1 Tax=Gymnopus androsaceus JB14 TaxID=1447944 RepID=A0A6A4IM06_9AGAR|nr:hypothetical protein BT96DRAFT_983257 [Gymnopus androsaceus JB14]